MNVSKWAVALSLGWMGVSALVTGLLRFKSDAEWIDMALKSPKLAALVELLKGLGFDPFVIPSVLRKLFTPTVCQTPAAPTGAGGVQ